ncbi:MAG TPA: glycerophosphodiester phosphodiesterase family protein [Solirubrobacteraceae bacterium]|nr:glycerophosphodiester phosphodiesterase family protein [Solirubrobacteraceae bacterium]
MPIVIAHRGASGYRPEHTLAAYELGARQGADYIEPDLVSTRDGELVARHENEISGTTDVADHPEFADRRTAKEIDSTAYEGWFVEDFTLAELKTLRARERIPDVRPENTEHDGRYEIPTLQEVIDLAARLGVGIYPETKHPSYHRALGLALEPALVAALRRNALDSAGAPVFVQSFDPASLEELGGALTVPLVQLVGSEPIDVEAIARYAHAIGPAKRLVSADLVAAAHAAGLAVHPYTFRRERRFLPDDVPDLTAELRRYYELGVDGVFTDNPDVAVAAG